MIAMRACLNPCCAGYYSLTRKYGFLLSSWPLCLNPCCAGYYSLTHEDVVTPTDFSKVLILVVLDTTL